MRAQDLSNPCLEIWGGGRGAPSARREAGACTGAGAVSATSCRLHAV